MKIEDIEKAALKYNSDLIESVVNYTDVNYEEDNYEAGEMHALYDNIEDAFKTGADWRINSVWHKPCDTAESGKDCLVEHMDGDGNVCICIDWRSEYEWVNACHYDKILRWAYIEDLLPNMKE